MAPHLTKESPIIIVGAGAFGLSSAIHLAQRGYHDVTLVDREKYNENGYSYDKGCDAASADINKVVRASYGSLTDYQEAALASIKSWKEWNGQIREGRNLPPTFTKEDVLFVNNGSLEMISDKCLTQSMKDSIINMEQAGYPNTQLVLTDASDAARAGKRGFSINPLSRPPNENYGTLDSLGGFVYADKACQFALHTAKSLGVRTVLGGESGTFQSFIREKNGNATGIITADGVHRAASLVIMACGGWTPTLLPQLDHHCETTAGSVCIFQLPNNAASWQRFAPENFPTWAYNLHYGEKGGLYGFPRDSNGIVKIGYRGTKYTNPQRQVDGFVRSVPATRWSDSPLARIPQTAAGVIDRFLDEFFPELKPCLVKTRLCWYTDTHDNHYIMDFVPGMENVMVASGGSGHAFHLMPVLGKYVVDRVEGGAGTLLDRWQWRSKISEKQVHNKIMEGYSSEKALQKQAMTIPDSLVLDRSRSSRL